MSQLRELLEQIRAGDEAAATEFVHTYEPYVRQVVRARLRVMRLRRVADSSDFCQGVMASFLIRVTAGEYHVDGTVDLKRLLGRMAVNKVIDLARKPEFRRPVLAVSGPGVKGVEPIAPGPGPGSRLAWQDLFAEVRLRLTESERAVSELRTSGLSWNEVAERLGEKPDAVRNRLTRALKRLARELGLDEADND